jgi:hypothetical protein
MKNGWEWGSDSELAEPMGRGVAVRGGWMEHTSMEGEEYHRLSVGSL